MTHPPLPEEQTDWSEVPLASICINCGTITTTTRCPACRTTGDTSWNATRNRVAQHRFRIAVLQRAGHQCQAVDRATGQRCYQTAQLQAHHLKPGDHDPATGLALCRAHHRATDPHAR